MAGVMAVESGLHDNRPDVYADVEDDDDIETYLSAAALAEALHVEDEAEAEAADSGGTCVSLCEWYVLSAGIYVGLTCRRKEKLEMRGRGSALRSRFLGRWTMCLCMTYVSFSSYRLINTGLVICPTSRRMTTVPRGQTA
jgi:hypothetical protein